MKPGYYPSPDLSESASITLHAPFPDTTIDLRIYPEAILTGELTAPSGEILAGLLVQAKRSSYDMLGHRWTQTAVTRTDDHGAFRLAVNPGEYVLRVLFSPATSLRAEVVLPLSFPEQSSSGFARTVLARGGETQHFELRAKLARTVTVTARLEPDPGRGNLRMTAYDADGDEFPLRATPTGTPGSIRMDIPSGTYLVKARKEGADLGMEAETRITVGDREIGGLTLLFSFVSPVPIELRSDPASSNNTPPSVSDLDLSLESTQDDFGDNSYNSERPVLRGSQMPFFNPAAGTYRLRSLGATWFIQSATYGTSDLLRQDLVIVPGAGAVPIRIVASNKTASLTGTVRHDGRPVAAWIYLISSTPSATPIVMIHSSADGSYSRPNIAPGTYRVIAFEHKHDLNFEDQETLTAFGGELRSVTLNSTDQSTLNLELAPFDESR
ncbi:carboxypeptidase-like regulatory domain-containing protein [Granulicella arctica]|uniref:carboxypeptidase-like regulatory domain-containing protein n=1 Tax=Granulicella arctica TaxID=940613 RepID=UPI0021E00AA0|nr:carboxypeptidase-like regulatory domain-containing protein [Granulicella arctica]